jgi:hypothetical protein
MTTLEQSQQSDWLQTELESMSSQADSLAKTSPLQESKRVLKASAVDYGQSAPVLLGSFSPDTPSLKTSQTCLMENGELGLSEFSGTFPRSGMMRSGTVYQLPNLARTTTEIGSGLWRTPAAANGSQGPKSKALYDLCRKTGQSTITLVDEVRHTKAYWPTPNASDNRDRDCMEDESVKRRLRIGKQVGLSTAAKEERQSGTLNPTWVEWLMGFPLGHTDLNA